MRSNPVVQFLVMHGLVPRRFLSHLINIEGGAALSKTLRSLIRKKYQAAIGDYSYGPFLAQGFSAPGLIVGRYASIGKHVQWVNDHPKDAISMHPIFYKGGLAKRSLLIDHDAWIGVNVVITPNCKRIGIGSIVGAGAVVTKDVPDFAIVGGVPARVIGWRFLPEMQAAILASKWWELEPKAAENQFVNLITMMP